MFRTKCYFFILTFFFYFLAHLLCESLVGPDPESPTDPVGPDGNAHVSPCSTTKSCKIKQEVAKEKLAFIQPPSRSVAISTKPTCLSLESSFTAEEEQRKSIECALQPARVYTITTQHGMLMSSSRDSKESLELDVLKEKSGSGGSRGGSVQPSTSPSSVTSSPTQYSRSSSGRGANSCSGGHHHHCNHHHHHTAALTNAPSSSGGISGASGSSSSNQQQQQQPIPVVGSHGHHAVHHHAHHHHHLSQPPLQTSVSAHNIRSLGDTGKGEAEYRGMACESCSGTPSRSQGSLDLESTSRDQGKQHRRLERMWSVDRVTGLERGERVEDTKEVRGPEIQTGGDGRDPLNSFYFVCFFVSGPEKKYNLNTFRYLHRRQYMWSCFSGFNSHYK